MLELVCTPIDDIRSPRWYWVLKDQQGEGAIAVGEADTLTAAKIASHEAVRRHNWRLQTPEQRFTWKDGWWYDA